MITLELSEAEAQMLAEILSLYYGDLRMEIAGTDNKQVREYLKEKEFSVKHVMDRLPKT